MTEPTRESLENAIQVLKECREWYREGKNRRDFPIAKVEAAIRLLYGLPEKPDY